MRFVPSFLPLLVAACTSTDPWDGATPLSADPEGLRAVVELPEGLVPASTGSALVFTATRTDLGKRIEQKFGLVQVPSNRGQGYRLSRSELDNVRQVQSKLRQWENEAPDQTQGRVDITIAACIVSDGPEPDARVSVWVSPGTGVPLVQVARNEALEGLVEIQSEPDGCR